MERGWIKIYRKIVENPYYFSEPFTRSQAWIDLLIVANHKDNFFYKRGVKVEVKRGQIGWDLESLGKRWQWSRGKVERFISELETSNQVVRQKTNVTTLISLVNYELYQEDSKPNSKANDKANSKPNEHQTTKQTEANKNVKNNKNEKNVKNEQELIVDKSTSPDYKICMDVYFEFYKSFIGMPPRISGADGKALKQIIAYFENLPGEYPASELLKLMFDNWNKLDNFTQQQVSLTKINHFLNEIISQLRKGKRTKFDETTESAGAIRDLINNDKL